MEAPISREIALRLGLAARLIPDTDVARLLRVLDDAIGLPPTKKKLTQLTADTLRQALDGEFADLDLNVLQDAVACLQGETGQDSEDLPTCDPYTDGDVPGSIRVACASNKAEMLDGHFGSCARFLIYQVSAEELRLVDIRRVKEAEAADDKNAYRAELIADCQVLYVLSVGGPAAAKIVKAGIHPLKFPDAGPARERVESLQPILAGAAPPWLSKVMGQGAEERVRFERVGEA